MGLIFLRAEIDDYNPRSKHVIKEFLTDLTKRQNMNERWKISILSRPNKMEKKTVSKNSSIGRRVYKRTFRVKVI